MSELSFPFRGIDRGDAFAAQMPLTTRIGKNVRGRDSQTGRRRGSIRPGTPTYIGARIDSGANKRVRRLIQAAYDAKRVTYSYKDVGENQWSKDVNRVVSNLAVDDQGNVVAITGTATITKYNSAGEEIWSHSPKSAARDQTCRAICWDGVGGFILAVSSGQDQSEGHIWRILEDEDSKPYTAWDLELEGFVEDVQVLNGELYAACNLPKNNIGKLVVYTGIFGEVEDEVPEIEREEFIEYPVNAMSVREKDGAIFLAHGPAEAPYNRGEVPQNTALIASIVDWTIKDLDRYERRIWKWHDASQYEGEPNSDVVVIPDVSGNGRDMFADLVNFSAPVFKATAMGGLGAFRFSGATTGYEGKVLSAPNPSTTLAMKDMGLSCTPSADSTSNKWARFIVLRVPPVARAQGCWNQKTEETSAFNLERNFGKTLALNVDSETHSSATLWPASSGNAWFQEDVPNDVNTSGGSQQINAFNTSFGGNDYNPRRVTWTNKYSSVGGTQGLTNGTHTIGTNDSNVLILTIVHMAGTSCVTETTTAVASANGTQGEATQVATMIRINGQAWDRYQSRHASFGTQPSMFGSVASLVSSLTGAGEFDLLEDIVLQSDSAADNGIISCPKGPRLLNARLRFIDGLLSSDTEVEKIEGYLAHKWRVAGLLPSGISQANAASGGGNNNLRPGTPWATYSPPIVPHPYQLLFGPPKKTGAAFDTRSQANKRRSNDSMLVKRDGSSLEVVWVIASVPSVTFPTIGISGETYGGIGYGVATSDDRVFSVGPVYDAGGTVAEQACTIGITDNGKTYTISWTKTSGDLGLDNVISPSYDRLKCSVDENGNFYLPWNDNGVSSTVGYSGFVLNPDGDVLLEIEASAVDATMPQGLALKPAFEVVDSEGDLTDDIAEHVYLGTNQKRDGTEDNTVATLYRVTTLSTVRIDTPPRVNKLVGVAAGKIRTLTSPATVGTPTFAGVTDPVLSASARYIAAAVLYEKVYFADGESYAVYDPRANEVTALKADKSGQVPKRMSLLATWRGRLVGARSEGKPHHWWMSAVGEPGNWDFYPSVITATQAIEGSTSRAGLAPDIVNCLIPYNDDLLIFGCDKEIWRLTGDPAVGAQFDLVTRSTGIAFGAPWCIAPDGTIFFFGSRGGVFAMPPGGQPTLISDSGPSGKRTSVQRDLESIDLATYHVEMAWLTESQSLVVAVVPHAADSVAASWWAWDSTTGAWWEDTWTGADLQPTAIAVLDGDEPDDRRVLLGRADGYVSVVDESAAYDGDAATAVAAIDTQVLLGPISNEDQEVAVEWLAATLARDRASLRFQLFSSDNPDAMGDPVYTGLFEHGYTGKIFARARGAYVWIKLLRVEPVGSTLPSPLGWSLERMEASLAPMGAKR